MRMHVRAYVYICETFPIPTKGKGNECAHIQTHVTHTHMYPEAKHIYMREMEGGRGG